VVHGPTWKTRGFGNRDVANPSRPIPITIDAAVDCLGAVGISLRPVEREGREWDAASVEAECFVEGPISSESVALFGQPNGVRSRRKWTIKRNEQQSLFFPQDFGRKVFPGEYRWGCTLGERTIAQGRFEYITLDQARVLR